MNSVTEKPSECLKLTKQKGVYPYEYMNSFKKFDECELPSKDKFYSSLKDKGINDKDYERAIEVWNAFKGCVRYIFAS